MTALIAMTFLSYIPALQNGFIWDDKDHITNNVPLRDLSGLKRIWLEPKSIPQYYPLVHTGFWIEYHLWGNNPQGYHVVNILFHAINALLLWILLRRLGVPGAWLAAAVFAVHPVHVESVGWITERKNVLSTLFFLMAFLTFIRAVDWRRHTNIHIRHWWFYSLALLFYLCALLSKTVTVTLPVVILIVIWWQRPQWLRRDWKMVFYLSPFFILGLCLGLTTVYLEIAHVGAFGADWDYGIISRCLIAGRALWFYLGKLLWPHPLIFFYERWVIDPGIWWQILFPLAYMALLGGLWVFRRRLGRGPLAAMAIFTVILSPALGFFNVFPHLYSFVADHFQYLASISVTTLVVALSVTLCTRWNQSSIHADQAPFRRRILVRILLPVIILALLGTLTARRNTAFRNSRTLWEDTLAKNPGSWAAHHNLAIILRKNGDREAALHHFREAVRLYPRHARARRHMAEMAEEAGRFEEAETLYLEAARLEPLNIAILVRTGNFFARRNRFQDALPYYRQILALDPGNFDASLNSGNITMILGQFDVAEQFYRNALKQRPGDHLAREYLSRAQSARKLQKNQGNEKETAPAR